MHEYLESKSANTYRKMLCTLKVFFRDFLKRPDIIADFKFPKIPIKLRTNLPSKSALKQFYDALPELRDKTIFLMYASSGLRCSEVLGLDFNDVDFSKRMIMPNGHTGSTKVYRMRGGMREWVNEGFSIITPTLPPTPPPPTTLPLTPT